MNLIEILKAKGIADEVAQAVLEDMKSNKIFTASEENLDIRYGKLKTQHEGVNNQLTEANKLIEELQKSNKGNEGLQQQVETYKTQVAQLQAQLVEAQIDGEVQAKMLAAGVKPDDMDYVLFKLKAKGKLEMGEDGKVKDIDDKIAALKQQFPSNFASESKTHILENKLPNGGDPGSTVTKEEFNKMGYNSRVELRKENPELYNQMMKG